MLSNRNRSMIVVDGLTGKQWYVTNVDKVKVEDSGLYIYDKDGLLLCYYERGKYSGIIEANNDKTNCAK